MKVELLKTIKLGDGKLVGKGSILSAPFPPEISMILSNVNLIRKIEEPAKPTLIKPEPAVTVLSQEDKGKPVTSSKVEVKSDNVTLISDPKAEKKPKIKKPKR